MIIRNKILFLFSLVMAGIVPAYGMIVAVEEILAVIVEAGLQAAEKGVQKKSGMATAFGVAGPLVMAVQSLVTSTSGNDVNYYVMNMTGKAYNVKLKLHCLRDDIKVTINAGEVVLANTAKEEICLVEEVTLYEATDKDYKNPLAPGTIKYNIMDLKNLGGTIIEIIPGSEKDTIGVAAYIVQDGELKGVNPKESSSDSSDTAE